MPRNLFRLSIVFVLVLLMAFGSSSLASAGRPKPTPTPPPGPAPVTVTIGFDDGYADQYLARAILAAHAMQATFYVNTGVVGDSVHLTWAELTGLFADGNEIGGHGLTHANLKNLKGTALRQEICTDRINLFDQGFQPVSFAYPFGNYNSNTIQALKDCGYNSGRTVSLGPDSLPPHDPYATWAMPSVKNSTSVATIEGWITQAEQSGGGWVQLVFHHVCDNCDVYSISAANFTALLDWLQPRSASGTVVRTVNEVIGGVVKPPIAP